MTTQTRTHRFHDRARRAAALALAAIAVTAGGALQASAEESHAFPAKADLNGRQEIGQPNDAPGVVVDKYRAGQDVPVVCQQEKDGAIWDKTADDLWVPDQYVRTGVDGFAQGVPRCDQGGGKPDPGAPSDVVEGEDTANHEGQTLKNSSFLIVKATEGTTDELTDPDAKKKIQAAKDAGQVAGAYHFASPNGEPAAKQVDHFIAAGGGWSPDSGTLPGVLDLEEPGQLEANGGACFGKSPQEIVNYVREFSDTYLKRTGTRPIIYTRANWWNDCTGGNTEFGNHPLWIASYDVPAGKPGDLPAGWKDWTIHQYTENPDINRFHGNRQDLDALANKGVK